MNLSILAPLALCALALSRVPDDEPGTAPGTQGGDETAADASLVLRRSDEAFCAETARDGLDGWMSWFDDEALALDPFGQLWRGPVTLREHYQRLQWPPAELRWEPTDSDLSGSGELGYTVGRWHIGETREGNYLTVWRRDSEGRWRVLMDQGGDALHRSRVVGDSAPHRLTFEDLPHVAVESGDMRACLGRWVASGADDEVKGTYLTVWKRNADGWQIAASIGARLP